VDNLFSIHYDKLELLDDLTTEEQGLILMALIEYQRYGTMPAFEDRALRQTFKAMSQSIDYLNNRRDEIKQKRAESGAKGGRPKKYEAAETEKSNCFSGEEEKANSFSEKQNKQTVFPESKKSHTDTDTDTDTDTNTKTETNLSCPSAKAAEERQRDKTAGLKKTATEILTYLNHKTGTAFKAADGTLKNIIARLREHDPDTCRSVIDSKAEDPYFRENPKYYHPETLFRRSNFEKYRTMIGAIPDLEHSEAYDIEEMIQKTRAKMASGGIR
jgi:uncharacterized phage protein (TIGR02220 family)